MSELAALLEKADVLNAQMALLDVPLAKHEILELHRFLTGVQDEDAGRYRERVVVGSNRIFSTPLKVPDLMQAFVAYINSLVVHPSIKAARAHLGWVHKIRSAMATDERRGY